MTRNPRCSPACVPLRKERSDAEGVPAYALFTNEQLAEMVQRRVSPSQACATSRGSAKRGRTRTRRGVPAHSAGGGIAGNSAAVHEPERGWRPGRDRGLAQPRHRFPCGSTREARPRRRGGIPCRLDRELSDLQADLIAGTWAPRPMRQFRIHDPKPRLIHAPCFRDRVAHHAIMAHVGPVLDRVLVFDTYACRTGKGTLAAVQRATEHAQRHAWFGQIDVRAYFASIDHAVLLRLLERRFKT